MIRLYFILLCSLCIQPAWSQNNWDVNIGMGRPSISNQYLIFYNPSTVSQTGPSNIHSVSFLPGLTTGVGFKHKTKWLRLDGGVQCHQYGFSFIPKLESTNQQSETRVNLFSLNLFSVINFSWKNWALGFGPNLVYLTKPKMESSIDLMHNMKVVNLYSLGLKFNLDYSFQIRSQNFIIGYFYDRNQERSQLRATLVYNKDSRDFYYLEIPTRFHYLRLAYAFK